MGNPVGSNSQVDQGQATKQPTPPSIGDQSTSAENQPTEGTSPDYQSENLKAQQTTANATDEIARWSKYQVFVTAVGSALLIVTICLTYRATRAAERAVEVASSNAENQLRAYVNVIMAKANWEENNTIRIEVRIKNTGQTPAYGIIHRFAAHIGQPTKYELPAVPDSTIFKIPSFADLSGPPSRSDLGAGVELRCPISTHALNEKTLAGTKDRTIPVSIWGEIQYRDIFKRRSRLTRYRMILPSEGDIFVPSPEGNECDPDEG